MKTRTSWRTLVALLACLAALGLASCDSDSSGDDGNGQADVNGNGGDQTDVVDNNDDDTGGDSTFEFAAGQFQLTTHAVQDGCLDGGLALLFQPGGDDVPYDLQYPTEFPAYADLPTDITVRLQEPFSEMGVSLVAADTLRMVAEDSLQSGVLVNEEDYGDCSVDMLIDADIQVLDADNLTLTATLQVSNWQSSGDTCPPADDPCTIVLEMQGRRL